MLCCIRRTKPVEKNEEADEKMEQEANKPEDKAHKAATKIQASFRGHIIRKKLKSEKKEDSPAAQDEKKKTSPVAESAAEPTENSKATSQAKSPSADETTNTPATIASSPADAPTSEPRKEQVKQEAGLNTTESKELENVVVAEEGEDKISSPTAKENTTANECPESAQSLKPVEGKDKEEPKQAIVPAANDSETIEDQAQSKGTESDQPQDRKDAVEESKPTENSHSEAGKEEDKADQDKI